MTDHKNRNRVAKLRQERRSKGLCETNVWLPQIVRAAIDQAVQSGEFPSRRIAITHALERVFVNEEK